MKNEMKNEKKWKSVQNEWNDDEDAHGKNLRILYYIRSALVSDMLRYIFERIKYQNLCF